jgi:hypothetical protein
MTFDFFFAWINLAHKPPIPATSYKDAERQRYRYSTPYTASKQAMSKKTQTITTKITPHFGPEFHIAAILPIEPTATTTPDSRPSTIPFTIHISKTGSNTPLGCYVYTIPHSKETYQTLLNNSTEELVDMGRKLGRLISKKWNVPSYVSVSGDWRLEEFLGAVKETVKFVQDTYT